MRRSGFTLMEVLLVLVVMVIVGAISIPIIQTTMEEARISASGDLVRGRLAETRARAMEDGRPWRFGFMTHSGIYQIAPEDADCWTDPTMEPDERADLIRDTLPKDVVFALTHQDIFDSDSPGGAGGGNWELGAVFMPDGTARDDAIIYFGKPGRGPMRANLRGLTGNVNIETFKTILATK
jgi:prepilin-type N-terminal cleavage/methylation domain-containing protein